MEQLSDYLQEYKELVGTVAGIVTIGQFFSGAFLCKDVYKKKSTDGISPNPFIGGILIGILMLRYASILDDNAMLVVNISAILLNVAYLLFFISYMKDLTELYKPIGVCSVFTVALLAYAQVEKPENLEFRFGLIVTALMLLLVGSPLFDLRKVIETQDSSSLPYPLILSGVVVSFLWLIYGIILLNEFMVFQNCIGLLLCVIQLVLCIKYPNKRKTE